MMIALLISLTTYLWRIIAKLFGARGAVQRFRLGYYVAWHADPNQTIDPLDPHGAVEVTVNNQRFDIDPTDPNERAQLDTLAIQLAEDLDCETGSVRIGLEECIFRFTRLDVLSQATGEPSC